MLLRIAWSLLPVGLLLACGEPPAPVHIPFTAAVFGAPTSCESGDVAKLTDLRLYVYELRLTDAGGRTRELKLQDDGNWQRDGLALLDLENGSGGCINGTAELHTELVGTLPAGAYRGLAFTVGVPFDRNHRDPLLAAAPLDDAAMHWHWRGGYKFLRAGMQSADDGFWIHLGSTGCEGTLQNISGCTAPNRVTVQLDDFVPGRDTVRIDLGALLAANELDDGTATDCSSGPAEAHCAAAFQALGLGHGGDTASGVQRVFSSHPLR